LLPEVRQRTEIVLADPADPATQQPYHAGFGALETHPKRLASRIASVRRAAALSVSSILQQWLALGVTLKGAALVVGSVKPPEAIANEHIRAHALEGQLFRTVLAEALASHGVTSTVVPERDVYREAAAILSRDPVELKVALADLGTGVGTPWQADHKLAALAAWSRLS
jgi:hypothetical protein